MKQFSYRIPDLVELKKLLQSEEISQAGISYKSLLVQIYSAKNYPEWYFSLGETVKQTFPLAIIAGASSVGEIIDGEILTNSTVVLFSFFESSSLSIFSYECRPGREEKTGEKLLKDVENLNDANLKGMLLLSTPISNNSGKIFNTITEKKPGYLIFGGGAGDYANTRNTLVFDGEKCFSKGIVAVIFSGKNLNIELLTNLGWYPLSKEMTITEVGEMSVKTIDNKPAFSVYEKYLGIKADDNFYQNSLEFPFLIYRNGQMIARTPFFVNEENGSIQLVADVKVGEKFRLGYGDPKTIIAESVDLQSKMGDFNPETIFLYTCICRRFLMQQDVDLETLPFNKIAPTSGFYTFGEFYSDTTFHSLLNSSMVAVGFREGEIKQKKTIHKQSHKQENKNQNIQDPYINKHSRILSRLLYFINVTTKELEEQNNLLKALNEQKNEFLGIAAHDLRSPLGAILGFSELLSEKVDDDLKNYTNLIIKASSTMLQLLNDLLDISKIEAGKLDLRKKETDYLALVKQNIKMNSLFAQDKNIQIISEIELYEQTLLIDEGKIEQVLNNLIGNAVKYSYPNSTVKVRVLGIDNLVITQVIDQGPGIPEKELNDVFYPFKRTSVRPTNGESSHGLGLAIVKKIVEGHDGQVGVTSKIGEGSTFTFILPIFNTV